MKKAIGIIVICALALTAITVGAAAIRLWEVGRLTVQLTGEQEMYVEFGQAYQEPGAAAKHTVGGRVTDIPVEISGQVDTTRVGTYLVKYTAATGNQVRTQYRRVHVADAQAPVITLIENPNSYTLPNQPYQEEGFFASDNYDGDLTNRVIREEADGKVTYTVSDSCGNTATVTRTIRYADPDLPQILLEGGQMAFIMAGDNYAEPGYTATDKDDGDLTASVVVSGVVDNLNSGIYTLQYSVTNKKGLTAKMDRTVYVIPKPETGNDASQGETTPDGTQPPLVDLPTGGTTIQPNGKVIYLTFDDGPSAHTARLLDVLAKYDVKATFFVMNTSNIGMISRTAQEGHTVAIHTYTHRYSQIYASDQAFLADLQAMQDLIYQHTGVRSTITRFPGGSSNSVSSAYNKGIMTRLTKELQNRGFQYFDWNVDSNDAGGAKTAEDVFRNVTKGVATRTYSVVLQHDTQDFSVDAVERIIAWGLCNGYTFKALDMDSPLCHHGVNN